jgi:hypothetical protein
MGYPPRETEALYTLKRTLRQCPLCWEWQLTRYRRERLLGVDSPGRRFDSHDLLS